LIKAQTCGHRIDSTAHLERGDPVATLVIRDLRDDVKARLRIQAAEHGHSMEAEARALLTTALVGRRIEDLGSNVVSELGLHAHAVEGGSLAWQSAPPFVALSDDPEPNLRPRRRTR
jgi:plasmid stability protein